MSELIERARLGDPDAFAALIETREESMTRVATAILGNPADAADALQEALAAIWRGLPGLRDPELFGAWSDRVLVNACRLVLKRRGRRHVREVAVANLDLGRNGHEPALDEQLMNRLALERALDRLTVDERASPRAPPSRGARDPGDRRGARDPGRDRQVATSPRPQLARAGDGPRAPMIDDEQLREALTARAGRAQPVDLPAMARAIAVDDRRSSGRVERVFPSAGRRGTWALFGGTATIVAAIAIGLTAVVTRPPSDVSPGASPLTSTEQLRRLLDAGAIGTVVLLDGSTAVDGDGCSNERGIARIAGLEPPVCVTQFAAAYPIAGRPYAAVIETEQTLRWLGALEPAPDGSWSIAELTSLANRGPLDPPLLQVVDAWLVGTPPIRCPGRCGPWAFLTDAPYQPASTDGVDGEIRPPEVGLRVQDGAYEAYAPNPLSIGWGVEPRRATWLVRRVPCPTGPSQSTCSETPWEILARLADPAADAPTLPPTPMPTSVPVPPQPWTALTWTTRDASSFDLPGNTYVQDAIALGDGFVAVGYTILDGRVNARLWTSPDGASWSLMPGDRLDLQFDRVIADDGELVIVGLHRAPDVGDEAGPMTAGMWRSSDGHDLAEVELPVELFEGRGIHAAAGGGAGWLLRVQGPAEPEQWLVGEPGGDWRAVDVASTLLVGGYVYDIVGTDDGWLATGLTGANLGGGGYPLGDPDNHRGAIWTSTDGEQWTAATVERPGTSINQVVRVAGGWIAVGTDHGGCPGCLGRPTLAWRSDDGRSWAAVEDIEGEANHLGGFLLASDGRRAVGIDTIGGWIQIRETTDGREWRTIAVLLAPPLEADSPLMFGRPTLGPKALIAFEHLSLDTRPEHLWALPYLAVPGPPPAGAVTPAPPPTQGPDTPCEPAGQECG